MGAELCRPTGLTPRRQADRTPVSQRPPIGRSSSVSCLRLVALMLVVVPTTSRAFVVETAEGPSGPVQLAWRNPERIPFALHRSGSDDMPADTTFRLLRESFAVWDAVPSARLGFIDRGLSSSRGPTDTDRQNLLFFDETNAFLNAPPNSGVIALTRLSWDPTSGQMLDADIIFNGRDFRFTSSTAAGTTAINLKDVAVHEIGHLLGLDHTAIDGPAAVRPTMNPYNRGDGPGEAVSLEADDIAGISTLYPAAGYLTETGRITGHVQDLSGNPLFGVHVVAEAVTTEDRIGTLTGADPDIASPGDYALAGLPPGAYRLYIEPLSGDITADNFGGVFHTGLATGFVAEYYDNATTADQAKRVEVAAAETIADVDFITGQVEPGQPVVLSLWPPASTPDTLGPYPVRAELAQTTSASLRYRLGPTGAVSATSMVADATGAYVATIPGQPAGTHVEYQIEATGATGTVLTHPGSGQWLGFDVVRLTGHPLACTALRGEDAVVFYDTGTGQEVSRVPVSSQPLQLLLDEAHERLFVSCLEGGDVRVIDTRTFQTIARLVTGAAPLDLALTPDGRSLYVTDSGAGSISRFDLATGTRQAIALPPMASGPYGIAVANDRVFVADNEGDRVLVLDAEGAILGAVDVPGQPRCLSSATDGASVFVTCLSAPTLTVIDAARLEVQQAVALPVAGTFAVTPSADGHRVYLTAHDSGALLTVDLPTGNVAPGVPVGANPRGLSLSADGRLAYVTSTDDDRFTVVDIVADTVVAHWATGDQPRGIVVLSAPGAGEPPTVVATPTARPAALTLSRGFPNPFNASVQIQYSLPTAAATSVQVYDLLGQPVRQLADDPATAGWHVVSWDGRDSAGRPVASGPYLVVLRSGDQQRVEKVLLLR